MKRADPDGPGRDEALRLLGDWCTMRVSVAVGRAQLLLVQGPQQGQPAAQPLTSLTMSNLWVTYAASALSAMFVSVNLPTLAIEDLRPGVPREQAMVLSTARVGMGGLKKTMRSPFCSAWLMKLACCMKICATDSLWVNSAMA